MLFRQSGVSMAFVVVLYIQRRKGVSTPALAITLGKLKSLPLSSQSS